MKPLSEEQLDEIAAVLIAEAERIQNASAS